MSTSVGRSCSGLLRLPHARLTIVDGFADLSPTRDNNACGRIAVRGLAAAADAGFAEGRGLVSAAAGRRRWQRAPSRQRACRRRSGSRNRRCMVSRELSESRRAWARSRRRGSGHNRPYRQLRSEDAPAGAARVRARRRPQAGTAGADLWGLAARGACLSLWPSLNLMTNQCVKSCNVARTVVEVRYLFRRRAGCVGN
jgi:hypothetical protein